LNVVLTLDSVIQNMVEEELAEAMRKYTPHSASGMVVRPRTGEILALAVLPNFDPNQPGKAKLDALRNRVIADTYEPGSAFKIVAIGGGLNERCIRLTDTINCENGHWFYGGKPLKDHGRYGVMTVENVVGKSSNIGLAKIGLMLGEERLYKYVRAFGFGSKTEIPLAGEVAASLPPTTAWDKLKITRIPMGQGVVVTHVQMNLAMCAVANQGRLMRPMLVNRLEYRDGQLFAQYQPQVVREAISEAAAKLEVTALKTVVSTNGTAPKAVLEHYTVAGKTGTAQKALNGVYISEYVASFVGFFPADAPELCISVVLDQPDKTKGYYGGQVAAPMFKAIAEQVAKYLKIRPDRDESGNEVLIAQPGLELMNTAALRQP
jgi:cell division protein FtsI/penicillin-binding protein 2